MKKTVWPIFAAFGLAHLSTIIMAACAQGSGFAIFTQDAAALGQGNAVIAHTDGPSSIFFNPALLTELEGTQVEAGATLIVPERTFKSDLTGKTYKTEHAVYYPSTLYASKRINKDYSAGLGVFSPFGLGTNWGNTWEGRYISTNARMTTFNINPSLAWRLGPRMSVGGGLNYLILDTSLESKVNLSSFGLPDANKKFSGDGDGTGYNIGLLYNATTNTSLGISYRSGIRVKVDGKADFRMPPGTPGAISTLFPNTKGKATINLPPQVHAGVSYKGFNRLVLEAGMRWEGWSSYDELKINLAQPVAGSRTSVARREWRDVYSATLGGRYKFNDTLALLAGYLYSGNAVPGHTFEPAVPDSDTHLFCLGSEVTYRGFRFALAYGYQALERRHKTNSAGSESSGGTSGDARANGRYDSYLHLISMSVNYIF